MQKRRAGPEIFPLPVAGPGSENVFGVTPRSFARLLPGLPRPRLAVSPRRKAFRGRPETRSRKPFCQRPERNWIWRSDFRRQVKDQAAGEIRPSSSASNQRSASTRLFYAAREGAENLSRRFACGRAATAATARNGPRKFHCPFRVWSSGSGVLSFGFCYPTLFSISKSIRRLSSTLYSMGKCRMRSLTKPLTDRLMASASERPRWRM